MFGLESNAVKLALESCGSSDQNGEGGVTGEQDQTGQDDPSHRGQLVQTTSSGCQEDSGEPSGQLKDLLTLNPFRLSQEKMMRFIPSAAMMETILRDPSLMDPYQYIQQVRC